MIAKFRALLNRPRGKPGNPAPLLLVMPHICYGGAERWAAAIARELHAEGHPIILAVLGEKIGEANAANDWFAPYVRKIHFADEWERQYPASPLSRLIERWNISSVVLVGHSSAYGALPRLRALHGGLNIVSFQFNAIDLCEDHLRFAPFIDAVIVEGADVADQVAGNGFPGAKLFIIPSALHLISSVSAKRNLRSSDRIRIGFIGRMEARSKNPRTFLEMAQHLQQDGFHFLMIGDGPDADGIEQWIETKADEISMELIRHITDQQLTEQLAALDILVVTSLKDGRPLIIREAQALKKPVVASRVGSIPDLISDGETGILCEPGNALEFAEAVRHLVKNPALRVKIGDAGFRYAERESDIRRAMPALKNVLFGSS